MESEFSDLRGTDLRQGMGNFSFRFELAGNNLNYINRIIYISVSKDERKDRSYRTLIIS
jgi:hypothetical protein